MSKIHFRCSHCSHGLRADESMAGKVGKCPKCGENVPIPAPPPVDDLALDALGEYEPGAVSDSDESVIFRRDTEPTRRCSGCGAAWSGTSRICPRCKRYIP